MIFYTFCNIKMMYTNKYRCFSYKYKLREFNLSVLLVTRTEYDWLLPAVVIFNFASSVRLRPNLDAHISSILT